MQQQGYLTHTDPFEKRKVKIKKLEVLHLIKISKRMKINLEKEKPLLLDFFMIKLICYIWNHTDLCIPSKDLLIFSPASTHPASNHLIKPCKNGNPNIWNYESKRFVARNGNPNKSTLLVNGTRGLWQEILVQNVQQSPVY